jgi:hypothetical protein
VSYPYAGTRVWLRPSEGTPFRILATNGRLLATHTLSRTKGLAALDPQHYAGMPKRTACGSCSPVRTTNRSHARVTLCGRSERGQSFRPPARSG